MQVSLLEVNETKNPKPIPDPSTLVFGKKFTDHMLCIPWNAETGWGVPKIEPYGPLALDPSCTVLHYAPTLFEGQSRPIRLWCTELSLPVLTASSLVPGMKAYKGADGVARLFRPDKNFERMKRSAARLAFPDFSAEKLGELLEKLVALDSKWIPTAEGTSLYIRPTMIGTQASLGVGPSADVLLFVIMSPVGPYYPTGFKPIKLLATTKDVRAWPGGTGGFKLGQFPRATATRATIRFVAVC